MQYCPTHGRFCNHRKNNKGISFYDPDRKKTVTIISGFLGSGKTTLVNNLIAQSVNRKIDVLVREYGTVAVDDRLLNMDKTRIHTFSGMSMHESKEEMLGHYLERIYDTQGQHSFDHLLVETSGAENAERLVKLFMQPELRAKYDLSGFITVVDAKYGHVNLDEFSITGEQAAFADLIVINKQELLNKEELISLSARLKRINPCATVITTSYGNLDYGMLECSGIYGQLKNIRAEDAVEKGRFMDSLKSVSLTTEKALDRGKVDTWLRSVFEQYGERILRGKGFFYISGSDYIFEFQSVRNSFHSKTELKWKSDETPKSVVVFIGRDIPDVVFFQESLNECSQI